MNGHAYRNRKSDNTNFAFLSKVILTDPVSDSHGYGVAIGRLASLIGGGKPILQRFGDLRHDFIDVGEFRFLAAFAAGEVEELSDNRVHLLDVVDDSVARVIFAN